MRELRKDAVEKKDRHDVSEITATKYVYQDKYGILHASDFEDTAYYYSTGAYVATDEITTNHGYPVINGVQVKLYGAGEGYVYTSKYARDNDIRCNVTDHPIEGTKFEHVDLSSDVKEAYRIANEFYMMLTF